ncbi:sperm flagellar protein 2 [Pholidichthys leucotaenia]
MHCWGQGDSVLSDKEEKLAQRKTMSDILCRWLNQELRLSKAVEPKTFAKDFSSGYLIGEVLHKYELQSDFSQFMKKDTSISKLNNFTRLKPTLQLLGISFDTSTAEDLMQEKHGVAMRLLYQLYVSLEKNKKAEISSTVMEVMQPASSGNLCIKEHEIHSNRLHPLVKYDAELKLQRVPQHYEEKSQQRSGMSALTNPVHQKRLKNSQTPQGFCQTQSGLTYNQATNPQVPKPPPNTSQLNLKRRQHQCKDRQAQMVQNEIARFETNKKKLISSGFSFFSSGQPCPDDVSLGGTRQVDNIPIGGTKLTLQSNAQYIQEIRQRLEENAVACEQREKRCDRFLMEQLKSHEAQQEARREEQLVKRLTRQTREEQRLVTQLLQIRMQKEVIRENRLFREQQYQQRRERDFQEALDREAALAQQAKLDRAEEIRKKLEFYKRLDAERAQSRHKKHSMICKDILEQIVDLATKIGEYRLLTGNLIPQKLMREWKELLFTGLPLYDPIKGHRPEFEASLDSGELKKQELLNNQDYDEYTNMMGEWAWPEEAGEAKSPPTNNHILGHVVQRLRNIVHPPTVEPSPVLLPFAIKACVLGKFCSGKTTCLAKIAEAHGLCVLSLDVLIEEALNAYRSGEIMNIIEEEAEEDDKPSTSTSLKSDIETQDASTYSNARFSTRAMHGEVAEKELRKGNAIANELLVDIVVEGISRLPAQSGWILDGFPLDITQAHLLEKALGGCVNVGTEVVNSRTNLAADPHPPEPPPPPAPVLDLALLLDVPDDCVVKRAYAEMDSDTKSTAAATPQPTDKTLYQAQIAHRITAFKDTWPELEKWFGRQQNILVRVNADVDEAELYNRVESVLQQDVSKPREVYAGPAEDDFVDGVKPPGSSSTTLPPILEQPPPPTDEALSPLKSCSSSKEEMAKNPKEHPRKSVSSVSNEDPEGVTKHPLESVCSCPDSFSCHYVDEPLPPELPEHLCLYWDTVCDAYVNNVKTVMQQLRSQRSIITHHLYNIREDYKHYLGRPDLKQELISQWQKDFNSISDDMSEDEDTKAELHLRLDEVRERLWDIIDKRKEEDEQERETLMKSGWLEEHTTVIVNHHSVLMQVELNRFQETLSVLRVYYMSMYGHVAPKPVTKLVYISLLKNPGMNDQDESGTQGTSTFSQMDDGEDKKKMQFTPLTSCATPSGRVSKSKGQDQTESFKILTISLLLQHPHEKLISECEEALIAIGNLVSAESHQGKKKEQENTEKEKEKKKETKSPPSPPPPPTPPPDDKKPPEKSHEQEVKEKIQKLYMAALKHEEHAAKVRIELVRGHCLAMMHSLQSRAEQVFSSMEKWLQARYLAEMKSIDQLTEVVRRHIEAGTKLLNELVLDSSDFYLNGDYLMVASPALPPRPPPLEKTTHSTPTIAQLQSLHHQLYNFAPSGFMHSSEFYSLLKDILSVNMGRNIMPEPWLEVKEKQLMEIVSLLTNDYELIDWRRFLLSAALPWPSPSLTQLLDVLQRLKAVDTNDTGYINEEQYLQTELWFLSETVQTVPEDPSDPLPYDRLANLPKFFFQLFADHSVSPPRLDYMSMLQYFAADPNPQQGFIRALSIVVGKHLKYHSQENLVKSMPRMEEAPELTWLEADGNIKEEETQSGSRRVDHDQEVSIPALISVISHKMTKKISSSILPFGCLSQEEHTEHLEQIFSELGYKPEGHVSFSILSQHPYIQFLIENTTTYQLVNIHRMLLTNLDEGEANSSSVS